MFDDPSKSLKKIQEQLLAAEEQEDIFAPAKPAQPEADAPAEPAESPAKKRTRTALLVALLLLEVAALLMVLAWRLLW